MPLRLLAVALLAACTAPSTEPTDSEPPVDAAAPPDAPDCTFSADVTGSVGSFTLSPIANAGYQPSKQQGEVWLPEHFSISATADNQVLGYNGASSWTFYAAGHDIYPAYLPLHKSFSAVKTDGCWTVTFAMTFNRCDSGGGNCVTPAGGFAGTVHIGR